MQLSRRVVIAVCCLLILGGLWASQSHRLTPASPDSETLADTPTDDFVYTSIGSVPTLMAGYERWKGLAADAGLENTLVLSLRPSALTRRVGHEGRFKLGHGAHGRAMIDLVEGQMIVAVKRLPTDEPYDVWLIDNRPGPNRSVRPEPGDRQVHLGYLQPSRGEAKLEAQLHRGRLQDFELDIVAVTPQGTEPGQHGLLFGMPSLYQMMYYNERQGDHEGWQPLSKALNMAMAPFRVLVPSIAEAVVMNDERRSFDGSLFIKQKIQQGEETFFTQTFEGNGRTCGTCHPIDASFT